MSRSAVRWVRRVMCGAGWLVAAAPLRAQVVPPPVAPPLPAPTSDTVRLTFAQFRDQVLAGHPVAVQARQAAAGARAELTIARGAFDPRLEYALDRKRFSGDNYYTYSDAALKIPTFIGSDIKLGYERTDGIYFNNDRRTPERGLLTLGMTVPLGQRIITDERRTALRQARALLDAGEAERIATLNDLVALAARDYAGWYEAWQRFVIAQEGVELADFRLDAVRQRVSAGDSPPVDTLEASLEVRRREVTLGEALAAYFEARRLAETYLWTERGDPIVLEERVFPSIEGALAVPPSAAALAAIREEIVRTHPDVIRADAQVRVLEAQRLLNAQGLLPFAEASLSALANRDQRGDLTDRGQWDDNHKVGFFASTPLLFMRERGRLGLTGARLQAARAERDFVRRLVVLALDVAANDVTVLAGLRTLQASNVIQAGLLRDAEQIRFLNGESTLLIVNLRERLVLDELVKQAQIEARGVAALAELGAAIGDIERLPEVLP